MKKIHLVPYCIALMFGNCFLPSALSQAAEWLRELFSQTLTGGRALPSITLFSLAMPVWFYIFTTFAALAIVGLFIRKISASFLIHWILAVCVLECLALVCFIWGICLAFEPIGTKVGL